MADAAPTRVVAAGPDSAPTRVAGARGGAARRARRRRRVTLVLAILLVLALAAGGYVLYRTFLTPLTPVPKVVGSSQSGAVSALQKDGFTVALHSAFSDKYADGYVVRQTPAAGSRLADGGKVHLWIRKGPVHVRLPDFRSQTPDQVATLLARYDLVSQRRRGASRTVAAGLVFSQRPAAGATVARGDTVAYWVSTGMPKAVIPDVVGSSYGSAKSDLQAAGFAVSLKTTIAFGELPGTVVSQAPLGGSKAREGSVVTIWVALF